MKQILVLSAVGALLLGALGAAQVPVIPFKVVRTIPHTPGYGQGLAWENETIWMSNISGSILEQYDPFTGTRIRTVPPPNTRLRDLTFDGMDLWMASWYTPPTPSIFTMDPITGKVLASFIAPFPTGHSDGMAWDGKYLYIGDEVDDIHLVDPIAWKVTKTLPVPSLSSSNPRGLAWDTRTQTIWAGYQSKGLIRKHNPSTGNPIEEFGSPYTWSQQGLTWDGWFLWATGGSQQGLEHISQIDVTMPFMVLKGSLTPSTSIQFELTRADNQSGNMFVVGWSGSGTTGFQVGGKTVHLTFDNFTLGGLALIPYFQQVIDTSGSATTSGFPWPNVPAGISFWVCGVTLDTSGIVSVCEPIKYVSR